MRWTIVLPGPYIIPLSILVHAQTLYSTSLKRDVYTQTVYASLPNTVYTQLIYTNSKNRFVSTSIVYIVLAYTSVPLVNLLYYM